MIQIRDHFFFDLPNKETLVKMVPTSNGVTHHSNDVVKVAVDQ